MTSQSTTDLHIEVTVKLDSWPDAVKIALSGDKWVTHGPSHIWGDWEQNNTPRHDPGDPWRPKPRPEYDTRSTTHDTLDDALAWAEALLRRLAVTAKEVAP